VRALVVPPLCHPPSLLPLPLLQDEATLKAFVVKRFAVGRLQLVRNCAGSLFAAARDARVACRAKCRVRAVGGASLGGR